MTVDFDKEDDHEEEQEVNPAFAPIEVVPDVTASRNQMAELHQLICLALSRRIASGLWSSGDIAAAAKFLKDNNITADVGDNESLQQLRDSLAARQKARREANKGNALSPDELARIAMEEVNKDLWH